MQFDLQDVERTARVEQFVGGQNRLTVRHRPTGIAHELLTDANHDDLPWQQAFAELRSKINGTLPPGRPDKLVKITEQGVRYRLPWAMPGWLYVVRSETPSPDGTYKNVHVTDSAGNIWSLGKGDYEPIEQV